jgi:hypothetical protein
MNTKQYIILQAQLVNDKPIFADTIPYIPFPPSRVLLLSSISGLAFHLQTVSVSTVSQIDIIVFKVDRDISSSWTILLQRTFGRASTLFIKDQLFFI